jgi:hemerythrin-like domain-containing protein
MNKIETKRFERYDTIQKISFRTDSSTAYKAGITHNISKKGLLLESKESIPQGESLELVLKIDDTPVHFKGKCLYCTESDQGNFQSGILVLQVNTTGMKVFLSFINTLEKKRVENQHGLRPETADMKHVVQRISAEHKIITQYVVVLRKLLADKAALADLSQVETVLDLMKKDVTTHFRIEEKVFFKIGLTHLPTKYHGLIRELTKEHAVMLHKLDQIMESAQGVRQRGSSLPEELKESIEGFLDQVKEHAKKEIVDLFPILEDNAQAKSQLMLTLREIVT